MYKWYLNVKLLSLSFALFIILALRISWGVLNIRHEHCGLLWFTVCMFPDDSVHQGVKAFWYSEILLPGSDINSKPHSRKLLLALRCPMLTGPLPPPPDNCRRPPAPKECQRQVEPPELLMTACSRHCKNGHCTPTGKCCCSPGWEGPLCRVGECPPFESKLADSSPGVGRPLEWWTTRMLQWPCWCKSKSGSMEKKCCICCSFPIPFGHHLYFFSELPLWFLLLEGPGSFTLSL